MDMDNCFDRTSYKGGNMERHLLGWTLFSSYPLLARHGPCIMDVSMNYIKVVSGLHALISTRLYLAYDDEPTRNSSARPEWEAIIVFTRSVSDLFSLFFWQLISLDKLKSLDKGGWWVCPQGGSVPFMVLSPKKKKKREKERQKDSFGKNREVRLVAHSIKN